jgi:hypothetical protein
MESYRLANKREPSDQESELTTSTSVGSIFGVLELPKAFV